MYHAVPVKSGDGIHIQREISSPQQGATQQQEDQVSKPLIYPVFELVKKLKYNTCNNICVHTDFAETSDVAETNISFGRAVTIQDGGV